MATRVKEGVDAGSQNVVAIATRAVLERQNFPEHVRLEDVDPFTERSIRKTAEVSEYSAGSRATDLTRSLMPDRVALNARAMQFTVDGLREPVTDANAANNEPVMQNRPTADSVMRNSFKIGCKLLIKIEPTAKSTKLIKGMIFDKFSLQGIAEADSERYQLHETFEDNVLFLFGRRPRIWTMQGIVLNGRRAPDPVGVGPENPQALKERLRYDQDWANRLLMDWDLYYRGSKAVEARARTYLAYDDSVIEATLLELVVSRNAQMPTAANASLTFALHERVFVGQEYVDGVTPANLKDLIDKTNAVGGFEKTVKPSEMTAADKELTEINREQLAAEAELKTAQAEENRAAQELKAVNDGKTQARADYKKNTQAAAQAVEDRKSAEKELETMPPGPLREEMEREVADAKQRETDANYAAETAAANAQALDATTTTTMTAINKSTTKEEDATAKRDTLTATSDQVGARTAEGQQLTYDQVQEAILENIAKMGTGYSLANIESWEATESGIVAVYYVNDPLTGGVTRIDGKVEQTP